MAASDPVGVEQPLQPVRSGGRARPYGVTIAIGLLLATLVWHPWGRAAPPVVPATPATPVATPIAAIVADTGPTASNPGPASSPGPTASPSPFSSRGPRPSFGASASGTQESATYLSLGDNDWSVVALLAPSRLAAADQRWVPDATGALQAPGGSLLVLQLGPSYANRPIESPDDPAAVCRTQDGFRDYAAAHLPADRVAYLGVTFPGMDPRARVTGVVLDRHGLVLKRLSVVRVPLSGMVEGRRYTVPTSGSGGAALFALTPPAIMPVAAYRFDIVAPGVPGHRYLYACIEP